MSKSLKQKAISLRQKGLTYSEISKKFVPPIPKGTLSGWLKYIVLSETQKKRILRKQEKDLRKARAVSLNVNKKNRLIYFSNLEKKLNSVVCFAKQVEVKKLILATLYLGEGNKQGGSTSFGNTDPKLVQFYLFLLRTCYLLDEKKFRITVQCRADQDIINLQNFWTKQTKIPLTQFYKARIDARSIGKKTEKKMYMGVCRIDYFSAEVFNELTLLAELMMKGP